MLSCKLTMIFSTRTCPLQNYSSDTKWVTENSLLCLIVAYSTLIISESIYTLLGTSMGSGVFETSTLHFSFQLLKLNLRRVNSHNFTKLIQVNPRILDLRRLVGGKQLFLIYKDPAGSYNRG